jgi:hypothetical protein
LDQSGDRKLVSVQELEQWRTELYFQCGRSERRDGSNPSNSYANSYANANSYAYAYAYANSYPYSNTVRQSDSPS